MPEAAHLPDPEAAEPREPRARSFLRLASHELRTPLNSILGFSEILAAEIHGPMGSPLYQEYAAIIRKSGGRLLGLVNEVLEIARLEGRMSDLQREPTPVRELAARAQAALCEPLTQHHLRVRVRIGPGAEAVAADPQAARTVVGNLLRRAAEFSEEGGEIRIRSVALGDRVEILIEDTGAADSEARAEGWGLALSVCHAMAQAMGGALSLEARHGAGERARLSLPRA